MPNAHSAESSGARRKGSGVRVAVGVLLLVGSIVIAVAGFVRLIEVLDHGGYGTAEMRNALLILGTAGAGLAGGIATLIGDVANRFEH